MNLPSAPSTSIQFPVTPLFPTRLFRLPRTLLTLVVLALAPGLGHLAAAEAFIHPGGLHTLADLERMRSRVAARETPWIECWEQLLADPLARHDYQPAPTSNLGVSRQRASRDAHAAYLNFIRWYVGGDVRHADAAIRICNAWSATVNQIPTGTDIPGLSGIPIAEFALVGELLRSCPRWEPADFARFQRMMLDYLYPVCHDFLTRHNGACISAYWSNWDIANIGACLAIGVLCDKPEIFDEGVAYFKNGPGMGSLPNAIPFLHPDGLGQWQESGRDQPHAQLAVGMMAQACQVAWNQGLDLFALDDNRLLTGAEYVARYNLGLDVPYIYYNNCTDAKNFWVSINGRGRFHDRPLWELVYNHYVVRRGLPAPHVRATAALARPEHGSADHFGYGTLTFTLDATASPYPPTPAPEPPAGLVATAGAELIRLSWSPAARHAARGHVVHRATSATGPYEAIASWDENTTTTYTDATAEPGTTYHYVVTARNQSGASPDSTPVSATAGAYGPLPGAWSVLTLGTVEDNTAAAPEAVFSPAAARTFRLSGPGRAIDGVADSATFLSRPVAGDFTLVARLASTSAAQAGLMMRESTAAGARSVALTLGELGGRQTRFRARATTDGASPRQSGNDYTWTPVWYKLSRVGDVFTAAHSADGLTWFEVGTATVPMAASYHVGFAVCAPTAKKLGVAVFDQISAP